VPAGSTTGVDSYAATRVAETPVVVFVPREPTDETESS
jgi:hypothetical protein